ncbi:MULTISPECIES: DinB family protein [Kitasatospora]|uniref:DinB-like domain-containing protein n=2 Tax=Kitasatospora TaxID=2063 RepID=A0ABT1ISN7_9ACTN|nr:DinB family protein [Kitasatospora paracochleata]MCP2308152.1 hypothetical protein [Kitasatospora paracochleata]
MPSPVTADDLSATLRAALATLRPAVGAAWTTPLAPGGWSCWETVEHVADGLFGYAAQLAPAEPPQHDYVPLAWHRDRPDGPPNALRADPAAGPDGLLRVLDAAGGILAAVLRAAPPEARAFHVWGLADPEGFAAMGTAELLLHVHDVCQALDLPWSPPAERCARVLARLFPDAPAGHSPWPTLLHATGRTDLPGHPRPTAWRWHSAPPAEA